MSNYHHTWEWKSARTPSGKTRRVQVCRACGLMTYSRGRLTEWKYPDGRVHQTATIDEPTCYGAPTAPDEPSRDPAPAARDTRHDHYDALDEGRGRNGFDPVR